MRNAIVIGLLCLSSSANAGWWDALSGKSPTGSNDSHNSPAPKNTDTDVGGPDFKRAAEIYKKGDHAQAFALFMKAAEAGDSYAQGQVGNMYSRGDSVPKDLVQSLKWSRASAEQGNAIGQLNLGIDILNGWGTKANSKEAVTWIRKSAEQGNAVAESLLGGLYLEGQGVPKSTPNAIAWLRKAAIQGNEAAQTDLGNLYHAKKIDQGDTQAATWYQESIDREKAAKAEKKAKRMDALVCKCQATAEYVQSQIDRENEIGKVSGVVDKVKLHNLGQTLVSVREFIESASMGRAPASGCSAKSGAETYQTCMEGVAEHASGQLGE